MRDDSQSLLEQLLNGEHLTEDQAGDLMRLLAAGKLEPARAGGLLAALRANGENADELRGFANAMRDLAQPFPRDADMPAADSVGTGGDGSGSFNLSTGCALLAATRPFVWERWWRYGCRNVARRYQTAMRDGLGTGEGS